MATFTNRALLSYNGITTPSNVVTGEILGALTVTKTSLAPAYTQGGSVTYMISLVNSGAQPLTGLTVTDDLGAYDTETGSLVPLTFVDGAATLFVNGLLQEAPQATAGDELVFTGIDVPALGNALITYKTMANGFAPLAAGSSIKNTAVVTGGGLGSPVSASCAVAPVSAPQLSVTKSVTPASVMENGSLTYDFVIENTGSAPAEADANLVLSDDFDPVLKNIDVTLDGQPLSSPTGYTYDESTGAFATAAGVITVPAAAFPAGSDGSVSVIPGRAKLTVSGSLA
ncbi:MAG: hypothetical protein K6G56_04350 [Clostridiales bacterium]|nr:hypothetical protein [Clostridiales bacterium]